MAFRDYFKTLSTEKHGNIDYVIIFKGRRVDIGEYPNLLNIGDWIEYGKRGYRMVCKLQKIDLIKLISNELRIKLEDFDVMRTIDYVRL